MEQDSSLPHPILQRMPAAVLTGLPLWALVVARPWAPASARGSRRLWTFVIVTCVWSVLLGMVGWMVLSPIPREVDIFVGELWEVVLLALAAFGFHGLLLGLAIGLSKGTSRWLSSIQ